MPRANLLETLPSPEVMQRRLRVFAMVDAIVAPEFRSFEFHPKWGRGEQMGAFKNGSGDFFFAWFSPRGAVLRGFDHESKMSPFQHQPPRPWPGLLEGLPKPLGYALTEPAFALEELTFLLWNTKNRWGTSKAVKLAPGADPDGAVDLLGCFRPAFSKWAAAYYGEPLHAGSLSALWKEEPLTEELVFALNPEADLAAVKAEAKDLAWPWAAGKKAKATKATASFGEAEFTVRCTPKYVAMVVHGKEVARLKEDVYEELFDLVHARLRGKK